MALLDQVLGYLVNQPQPQSPSQAGPMQAPPQAAASGLSPIAKSIMLVLAAKAWQAYSAQRASSAASGANGGSAASGVGGLLGALGGAAALSGLMRRFEQSGFADQANSWVGGGANAAIEADQIERAIGGGTIEELAARLQIPVEQLKSELASALPQGVDQLTPQGRLPSDADLQKL